VSYHPGHSWNRFIIFSFVWVNGESCSKYLLDKTAKVYCIVSWEFVQRLKETKVAEMMLTLSLVEHLFVVEKE